MTKKQLLLRTYEEFNKWTHEKQSLEKNLLALSEQLCDFLDKWVLVDAEEANQFVSAIPKALSQCDKREVFEDPMFPSAYTYLHMLERYRRTWHTLDLLFKFGLLPIGLVPLKVVDIGMGPGSNSYAIQDYYREINEFAIATGNAELYTNDVQLYTIERSINMCYFVHLFSECTHRPGPFGAHKKEFSGFFPSQESANNWQDMINQTMEDLDTSEEFAEWWLRDSSNQRGAELDFRLVIMSYFFTPDNHPDDYFLEVVDLFKWLRPGAVIVLLAATDSRYMQVLNKVQEVADANLLSRIKMIPSNIYPSYNDKSALIIKRFYLQVARILKCRTLVDFGSIEELPKDLWDNDTPLSGPKSYVVQLFRKGRF